MKNIKTSLLSILSFSLLFMFGCETGFKKVNTIPTEDFFKNPSQTSFKLSPSGEFISFLKPYKNRMNIFVLQIGEKDSIQLTNFEDRNIEMHFWANDHKIVFAKDKDGDENYKLFSVNYDGTGLKQLTEDGNTTVRIIDPLENISDEMIISLNDRDPRIFDVYRLNIETGKRKLIAKNPGNISAWITDHEGKLRCAVTTDGVNHGILFRENEDEEFKLTSAANFKETLWPVAFTFDNKYLYMISNLGRDKAALVKYDVLRNEELEVIFEHYESDVENVFLSNKSKSIAAVSYVTWKTELKIFNDDWYYLNKKLSERLPDREIMIEGTNKKEDKFLIRTDSDRSLGEYYFYDYRDNVLLKLAEVGPWLKEEDLSPMKPVTYKSRDGLNIHGYLTIPLGTEAKNLPVVVYPHGGPWMRNKWGFNNEVQFLANRGYAVLQMNYRGSRGYGRKFWEAGFGEWGLKMQDDITDGVNWLIKQGIADPNRIAIYGYSFGGYCALQGLVKTPDIYRCGISYAGIISVLNFMTTVPPQWEPFRQMLYEMVGNPNTEGEKLKNVSPYYNAEKIKSPVFFAQGKNDPRVDVSATELMVKKLKNLNVEVEYMIKENEGHGYKNEENRIEFYKNMSLFLDKHLNQKPKN
ncbi:MAG: S9 family peptidase [Ignavibacteriae bacterium HGW-Ignavibacteriae-2]|jgi:dipeptidyl aminopeptidase/acylaminoacyl peptidase|nr:MAG: S9 family peptidase [Ignavibacteriae bacterium HGW-Ignavibacteriae-2]